MLLPIGRHQGSFCDRRRDAWGSAGRRGRATSKPLALGEGDLDARRGSVLARRGKNGKRREPSWTTRRTRVPRDALLLTPLAGPLGAKPTPERGFAALPLVAHCDNATSHKTPGNWTFSPWARLVSNQRPLACEASALPLSYAPGAAILRSQALASRADRARRGVSGALNPQSAPAGPNSPPRGVPRGTPRRPGR